ncbi:MAG: hypothetical protein KC733_09710 [Candidatus Omnitrophica bacterium]|nr:hypothetical protein [Candidatus Omnitrophota bacterium]
MKKEKLIQLSKRLIELKKEFIYLSDKEIRSTLAFSNLKMKDMKLEINHLDKVVNLQKKHIQSLENMIIREL